MRALVVEDQSDLLRTLAHTLREDGFAVDVAADGGEGLWKALETDYDAVVLDVMLPRVSGWEVLRRLRQTKKTPVLMLTARDSVPDRIRGLNSGADDYLTKPCDLDELLARLRALIRRSVGQPRPLIEVGHILLDLAARTVSKEGHLVSLTAREYALVEFLALRRGKVVSRSALYEHLFDDGEDTQSNLIDVHVYNLRKKFGTEFISTRRGMGYCIK
ncbi:response regulator transcription factor [Roseimicrobium sp. ORNL1]|uniref:response regulator transcription factor n=1 Tax=Roseimicrobium sp. ORNL1 TaxID=2711231 RepID=UPI0013E1E785|nr:response regulator transcription factor [Roseimicrobium sp. ORNL1]QIF05684.1 response regulator transcription factor [Roseimicrobium sp. ORNL1]